MHRLRVITNAKQLKIAYNATDYMKYFADFPRKNADGSPNPYGIGYVHHPCCKWAAESLSNFNYLLELGIGLCKEHEYRFGLLCEDQKCYEILLWIQKAKSKLYDLFPHFGLTVFAQAIDERLKVQGGHFYQVTQAYRQYYRECKKHLHVWTKREVPKFITDSDKVYDSTTEEVDLSAHN
jgi:hypothetical protein